MGYEFVEHTADIAIRGWGRSERELFAELARGMSDYLFGEAEAGGQSEIVAAETVEVSAPDEVALLVAWLSKILLLSSLHHGRVVVREITHISNTAVRAKLEVASAQQIEDVVAYLVTLKD